MENKQNKQFFLSSIKNIKIDFYWFCNKGHLLLSSKNGVDIPQQSLFSAMTIAFILSSTHTCDSLKSSFASFGIKLVF